MQVPITKTIKKSIYVKKLTNNNNKFYPKLSITVAGGLICGLFTL